MYSVSIDISRTEAKEVQFTIPDFLKKYVEDADDYEDYIFKYTPKPYSWETDRAKEYQIIPEAYGVYFVYETPEGVKKHYKIDDFEDGDFEYAEDYDEYISFEEVKPTTLEEAMKRIEELEKKLAETEA